MKNHWPRPDFLPNAHRPPWLAWLWLLTAVLVLGTVVRDGLALQSRVQEQVREQSEAQAQLKEHTQRMARAASTATATPAATSPRNNTGVLTAIQDNNAAVKAHTLVQQLDHPWGRILYALESETPPGMQWLLFDHNSASAELRFEGLAPTSDLVLETVNRLSTRRGWSEVVLSRLQAPDARASAVTDAVMPGPRSAKPAMPTTEPTSPLWRFEIRASFNPRTAVASGHQLLDSR